MAKKARIASDAYVTLKKEVSRMASMANKRLVRLENNNLTEVPAYKQWVNYKGGVKFSVRGKSYNQLQQEMARLNNFLNATTSTVRGANAVLKEMADNTGIKYKTVKELQAKTSQFFALAKKVTDYLQETEGSAHAIGYKKIWESINQYIKDEKIALGSADVDLDKLSETIGKLTSYEKIDRGYEGYSEGDDNFEWF